MRRIHVHVALFSDQSVATDTCRVKIFDRMTLRSSERKMRSDATVLKTGLVWVILRLTNPDIPDMSDER